MGLIHSTKAPKHQSTESTKDLEVFTCAGLIQNPKDPKRQTLFGNVGHDAEARLLEDGQPALIRAFRPAQQDKIRSELVSGERAALAIRRSDSPGRANWRYSARRAS